MVEPFVWRSARRVGSASPWPGGCADTAWLGEAEREIYASFAAPARREEWLLGRSLAKELILEHAPRPGGAATPLCPNEIQICSRDGLNRPSRPQIFLRGRLQPWPLSIAHSGDLLLVALSKRPQASLGVDIAPLQSWAEGSLEMWFTERERRLMKIDPALHPPSKLWAVKEAVYKAVNRGEPFTPCRIEVRPQPGGAYTFLRDGVAPRAAHRIQAFASAGQLVAMAILDSAREEAIR